MAQIKPYSSPSKQNIIAVILAGGQGQRVGFRQKGLLSYQGKVMVQILLEKLSSQVAGVYINANAELEAYQRFTHQKKQVFSDATKGYLGPLAGMQAAWGRVDSEWIVFIPCDNPFIPDDFVMRLIKAYKNKPAPLIAVDDGSRIQPLYLLMHRSMLSHLDKAIAKQHLSVHRWLKENDHSLADLSECCANAFTNMNSLEFYDNDG